MASGRRSAGQTDAVGSTPKLKAAGSRPVDRFLEGPSNAGCMDPYAVGTLRHGSPVRGRRLCDAHVTTAGRCWVSPKPEKLEKARYQKELRRLQIELVHLQEWIASRGLKVCVVFEGRDAAGKGGAIKRITQYTNPRVVRIAALGKPTERERAQWYFQRYVAHLPTGGEMVLFDRSWYNRAGVERIMGFCTDEELEEFFETCPTFEEMIQRSGIQLIKYWFSVSDEEQERRFRHRIEKPRKRWKLSEMDIASWQRWEEYSQAKDEMFAVTDTEASPWWVVNADSKWRARLNCLSHLLDRIPRENISSERVKLPPRPPARGHERPPITDQNFIPEPY